MSSVTLPASTDADCTLPTARLRQLTPGSIPRPQRRPLYTLVLWLVALLSCLVPVLYLGLVAGLGWLGFHYYIEWAPRGGHAFWLLLAWIVPGFVISVLVLFLLKPLFAPRATTPEAVKLAPHDDAEFTAAVHALCAAIGIGPPREILLSHQVNAWVQFSPGFAGVVGGARTLTIGLPLVAGLTTRQLVGVLAHEFGHFAQRGGMRAMFIIHWVNHWLESRAYHPDDWDDRLQRWTEDEDNGGVAQLTFVITLWCLWLTRMAMRALFQVSFRMSRRLSQEMEFDADRYEAIVAGSDAFAPTAMRLRGLAQSLREVDQINRKAWREGRLVDDLPAAVAQRLGQWRTEDWRLVEEQIQADDATRYWDSHPADQARIANAQALRAAGLFRDERPAALLFADFPALCRRVTEHFYREMALDFGARNLIDSAQLLGLGKLPDAMATTWDRFSNGMLGMVPLIDPADATRLPASGFDWQGTVDELRRLGPDAAGLWQRLDRLRGRADRIALWLALVDMQIDFVMPNGDEPDPVALRLEHAACCAEDTPDRKLADRLGALFARRLHLAVASLEGQARQEADAQLALLAQLHALWPRLQRIAAEGRLCLRLHGGMAGNDDDLRHRAYQMGEHYRQRLTEVLAAMDDISLPDGQALGRHLRNRCGRLSSAGSDPFQYIQVTSPLEDAYLELYSLVRAELALAADAAERAHGVRQIRLFIPRVEELRST